MDLGQVQTDVETWLNITAVDAREAPVTALPVEFGDQPHKVHPGPFVLVYPGVITKLGGSDNKQYTYNEGNDEFVEQMWGPRRMTMRLSFRSNDQRWGQSAQQHAQQWESRAQSTRSITSLSGAGLALVGTDDLVTNDVMWSGRSRSQVETGVTFNLWGYELLPTTDEGYIKTVNMEWQWYVIDESGTPLEE